MPDTGNVLFDVSVKIGEELREKKQDALKTDPIQFGRKRATTQEWRKEIETNKSFRESELKKMGGKDFLKQWGGKSL